MSDEYRTQIAGHELSPESLMMGYGYRPEWSEGALKSPIFQTSTFTFESAAEGKRFFEIAYGLAEPSAGESMGLIYSRLNNPDLEILEKRLTLWDGAEQSLVFASGMAAITTTLLTFLEPGSVLVHTCPLYGGTDHFIHHVLPRFGVDTVEWRHGMTTGEVGALVGDRSLTAVLMETPANPTNDLFSIRAARNLADRYRNEENSVPVMVDNTFLGPMWQHPLRHGADIVLYSATKYIGGHSDLIAGASLGSHELMAQVGQMRTILGTMATPLTGWLMMRSLETLSLRMTRQNENAMKVATFLANHPKVARVSYLGLLDPQDDGYQIYEEQCEGPGAMISLWVEGGEEEAFRFLDSLQLAKLAVSLGSTESLIQHPASMTHAGVDPDDKIRLGVTDSLVRLSVGVENPSDIIADLRNALESI
ncbi:MAG: cystathionine gamma-synthase family protein [Actinobacteria bacterium]|nr:MAG: cystathionine gamma-synthase family protein [Actinomycetota bacterium]